MVALIWWTMRLNTVITSELSWLLLARSEFSIRPTHNLLETRCGLSIITYSCVSYWVRVLPAFACRPMSGFDYSGQLDPCEMAASIITRHLWWLLSHRLTLTMIVQCPTTAWGYRSLVLVVRAWLAAERRLIISSRPMHSEGVVVYYPFLNTCRVENAVSTSPFPKHSQHKIYSPTALQRHTKHQRSSKNNK